MRRAGFSGAVLLLAMILSTTIVAAGNAYSARTPAIRWDIPGYGTTDVCKLAGIENIARNTGVATAHVPSAGGCGTPKDLGAGYLGVKISGYRDGSLCGTTTWSYSSSTTDYWQIWSTLCSNPAGSQAFHTVATVRVFVGGSYVTSTTVTSPNQNY
jgi:hypothetical protein